MTLIRKWLSRLRNPTGFTLAEVTITMFVSSITLSSVLFANNNIQKVNTNWFQRTVALQDAHQVVEQMREEASYALFPSNVTAAFPDAAYVTGFSNLQNEQVLVNYNAITDPLDVTITVSWKDEHERTVSYQLNTLITQRE